MLENRRSSLTLETSARIDPKSEWFPVLVNAIHVHMLLLNSVYCDIVRPIDIDPHVRAKMLGLLFPGGESLDRSSDTYLPEHEAEAGSEGRARGVRTRYDRILGEDDAHDSVESHAPSHEKVRMPFEGSAQSAASATDASPGSLSNEGAVAGTAEGSPDASSQGAPFSSGSHLGQVRNKIPDDDWQHELPEELQTLIDGAPATVTALDSYFEDAVKQRWSDAAAQDRALAVYYERETALRTNHLPIEVFEQTGAFAAEMRVIRDKTRSREA